MFPTLCWWKSMHRPRLQGAGRAAAGPREAGEGPLQMCSASDAAVCSGERGVWGMPANFGRLKRAASVWRWRKRLGWSGPRRAKNGIANSYRKYGRAGGESTAGRLDTCDVKGGFYFAFKMRETWTSVNDDGKEKNNSIYSTCTSHSSICRMHINPCCTPFTDGKMEAPGG